MIDRLLTVLVLLAALAGGCVELGILLQGAFPDGSTGESGSGGSNGDNFPPDSNGTDGPPDVRLTVSNPNPLVGEEVVFTCELVDGDSQGATFAFQPVADRLLVDARAGTASYIVDQSDIGVEMAVTCTATSASGTSDSSNQQVVIPTQ